MTNFAGKMHFATPFNQTVTVYLTAFANSLILALGYDKTHVILETSQYINVPNNSF